MINNTYIHNEFIQLVDSLSTQYADSKALGKQGKYFKRTFNAAKQNFAELSYFLYFRLFKWSVNPSAFEVNHIEGKELNKFTRDYSSILKFLVDNNVLVINSKYKVHGFTKSFIFSNYTISLINNSRYKFNYRSTLIDISKYNTLYKSLLSFPSIYVLHFTDEEEIEAKFNKEKRREYRITHQEEEVENMNYDKLTYDEKALEEYCAGDELMEYYFTQKLKGLVKQPEIIWNRYYHIFHQLPKEFRTSVLRFNGKPIVEAFDVPGSDMHMLAKLLENYDIREKELVKFQTDVKNDFRILFGQCLKTGKAKSYVKTAFKKYLFARKDFYDNIRSNSTCWQIDQYFQVNFPTIREILINWHEIDINNNRTKGLWADAMLNEFETISVRMKNLLQQRKHMSCLTCHDAVYLIEEDAENITEDELKTIFYEALDLYVDRQEDFYNL